ncbi:Uncharacterised protein [Porphyromonas macacae]|uniref:Uncharacterized protein n=1 Tax=Porphyromonas macacae TaxID=28115 RepID=A0A379E9X7_9PORP|nr:Uncharacterised protein [Porphyromonas macacae]SUB89477.1 Uncharacterised protein [Porphyromonas macacae]
MLNIIDDFYLYFLNKKQISYYEDLFFSLNDTNY